MIPMQTIAWFNDAKCCTSVVNKQFLYYCAHPVDNYLLDNTSSLKPYCFKPLI